MTARTHHDCGARYCLRADLRPSRRCPACDPLSSYEKGVQTRRVQAVTRRRAVTGAIHAARLTAWWQARRAA